MAKEGGPGKQRSATPTPRNDTRDGDRSRSNDHDSPAPRGRMPPKPKASVRPPSPTSNVGTDTISDNSGQPRTDNSTPSPLNLTQSQLTQGIVSPHVLLHTTPGCSQGSAINTPTPPPDSNMGLPPTFPTPPPSSRFPHCSPLPAHGIAPPQTKPVGTR